MSRAIITHKAAHAVTPVEEDGTRQLLHVPHYHFAMVTYI